MPDVDLGNFDDFSGVGTTYDFDTGSINDGGLGGGSSGGGSSSGGGFGDIVSGVASIGDYFGGRNASDDLARTYSGIATDARRDAGTASGMADPYQQYRDLNANTLARIMSGEEDFRTDPGYQFRMNESMRETERGASARGYNRSGNVMAAMDQRSQDVASSEYNNIINRLTGLAGATPQNAIAGGQTYGNMMGNVYSAQANASGARGESGGGLGGMLGGVGSIIQGVGSFM